MSAIFQRARQHKFSRPQRLALFRSIACIEGEQNGHVALLAANTEIPPQVGLRPSRNIQRISLTSEMPQLELRQQGWAAVVSRGPPDRVCPIANDETAKVATPTKPITPNPPESLCPFLSSVQARGLGSTHQDSLGSIRPPRGRQSRNESERIDTTSIVVMLIDNNTNRPSGPGSWRTRFSVFAFGFQRPLAGPRAHTSTSPETQPEESASRTPRRAKVVNYRKISDPRVYCWDVQKNLRWKPIVSNHRN